MMSHTIKEWRLILISRRERSMISLTRSSNSMVLFKILRNRNRVKITRFKRRVLRRRKQVWLMTWSMRFCKEKMMLQRLLFKARRSSSQRKIFRNQRRKRNQSRMTRSSKQRTRKSHWRILWKNKMLNLNLPRSKARRRPRTSQQNPRKLKANLHKSNRNLNSPKKKKKH